MPKVITQPKAKTQTAFFRVASGPDVAIDAENQTLRGVKLMEVGATAHFKGADGKSKSVNITAEHITALLNHAGNRALPVHNTHEWFDAQDKENADSVERGARIGALNKFRRDDAGNLIADAVFKKGEAWDDVLFAATHNPEDTMFSAVFNYSPDDAKCIPLNFRCADIVPRGAATTALFSETQTQPKMALTLDDLKELLSTPEGEAYMGGILKAHGKMKKSAAESEAEAEAPAAEGATAAALKKFEEELTAKFAKKETELLATVETKAQAAATALLGKGGFQIASGEAPKTNDVEAKLSSYITAGAANRGVAIMRFAHDKPEEYNAARAAGKL